MSEKKNLIEYLVKHRDALSMDLDATSAFLETLAPVEVQCETPPDLSVILWKDAIGDRGPFQVAEEKANEKNAPFNVLKAYLQAHDGKATIQGYFVWKFTDSSGSVGRKPVKKE